MIKHHARISAAFKSKYLISAAVTMRPLFNVISVELQTCYNATLNIMCRDSEIKVD